MPTIAQGPKLMLYNLVTLSVHVYTTLIGSREISLSSEMSVDPYQACHPLQTNHRVLFFFFFETDKNSLWNFDWSGISFVD